jgi:RNA polymerase sigma-70 factor (ECF subfamily)
MWFWAFSTEQEAPSDEALMERFQRGESQALGILYDRYARRLRAYAARQGAKRPDDLVQDAFVRVVRNGAGWKGDAKFKTWLFQIARNLAIDASRRDRFRQMPSLDQPIGRDGESERTLGDRFAADDPEGDGERRTADSEFKAAYEAALATLPEEQRQVFLLRQYGDLSFAEIAAEVGINENTAKSRMRYALVALRNALEAFA